MIIIRKWAILVIALLVVIITLMVIYIYKSNTLGTIDSEHNYESVVDVEEVIKEEQIAEEIESASVEEEAVFTPEIIRVKESYTIAILGLDTRADNYIGRSDMMLILHVNHSKKQMVFMSFMRDLRVFIEGHGHTKLGHAYAYGREILTLDTFEQNFGISTRDYITLNFEDLVEIVDIIGGFELEINDAEARVMSDFETSGTYLMNGKQILEYSRIRNIAGGDFDRTMRQRKIVKKMLDSVDGKSDEEILRTVGLIYPLLQTNLDIDEIYEQMIVYENSDENYELTEYRFPDDNFSEVMIDGIYYLKVNDWEVLTEKIRKILEGTFN